MKPAPFAYHAPRDVDECLRLLDELGTDAALLAGGQSLVPELRARTRQPSNIVSIAHLDFDAEARESGAVWVSISPRVTLATLAGSSTVVRLCPFLARTVALVGNPAVRSRGTLCGNLAHADPVSELSALAVALGARVELRSSSGKRIVAAEDLFLGPHHTAVGHGEMIVSVEFPAQPRNAGTSIQEVGRSRFGVPIAGVVVSVVRSATGLLEDARIGCFGVGPTPIRAHAAEQILSEAGVGADAIDAAVGATRDVLEPSDDWVASREYRRAAVCAMLRRAIAEADTAASGTSTA